MDQQERPHPFDYTDEDRRARLVAWKAFWHVMRLRAKERRSTDQSEGVRSAVPA
jgi:hypothetical protein